MAASPSGFEWSIRDDVIIYIFRDSRRDTIDTWIRMTKQHREEFLAQGKPVNRMWLFDDHMMPTPYAVKRAIELANDSPAGMQTQVACVMTNSRVYTLMRYVFSRIEARKDYIRFFNNEADALSWLNAEEAIS